MCKSNGDHSLLGRRDGAVFGETAHAGERTKKPRTQNGKFPRISEKIPKNNRNKENLNDYLEEMMTPKETLIIVKDTLNKEYPLEYFKDVNEFMKIRKEISEQRGKYSVDIEPIYTWDTI